MATQSDQASTLLVRLERLPFSRWHRTLFILAFVGVMFDATDFAMFGAALPPIANEFKLNPAQAGFLATIGLIGAFVGALVWGTISDYVGRRTAFQATVGIFSIFTALVAASWNVASLAVFRFVSNFGLGGEVPVAGTLATEFMPTRLRGAAAGNVLAAFPVGLALAAALGLAIVPAFGWRALFAVGVLPALLLFWVRRGMPESVRYLLSRGKIREAEAVVSGVERAALGPNAASQPATAPSAHFEAEVGTAARPRNTVFALLAPEFRHRTILMWIVSLGFFWSSNGILFMLPTILTQRGFTLAQAISFQLVQSIAAIFGYSICSFLVDRYGRRPVIFLYYLVGAGFHLWFALAGGLGMYAAIAAVGWVNPGAFGPSIVYAGELYPTHLRATGVGWFFGIGRIASFMAPSVVGLMLAGGMGEYVLFTFALSYLVAAAALLAVGIETRGVILERVQEVAEREAGPVAVALS
jgi:MFS transporter, putative metabolite:H+ symporter